VDPVVQVDVGDPSIAVEQDVAAGTERGVRRGVFRAEIRLGLDDPARRDGAAAPGDQDAAEQVARDGARRSPVEAAR
jgi:hypothetical protein